MGLIGTYATPRVLRTRTYSEDTLICSLIFFNSYKQQIEFCHEKLQNFTLKFNKISHLGLLVAGYRNILVEYSALINYYVCNRQFALIIKSGSLLPKNQHPWMGLWC